MDQVAGKRTVRLDNFLQANLLQHKLRLLAQRVSQLEGFRAILVGSGSELHLALSAQKLLAAEGIPARVVSMPSRELFLAQDEAWHESVLPSACRTRVAVEAAATLSWGGIVGLDGAVVGLDRFGASAPYQTVYEKLGLLPEAVD